MPESKSPGANNSGDAEPPIGATAMSGRKSFGKYQPFATLGSGGMADVFLAIARGPKGFNKLVVIKSLRQQHAKDQSFVDMFLDEARLAARLNHPNVVHTHEVGDLEGEYFLAMEFLEGQSLNKIVEHVKKAGTKLGPVVAARIASDALAGLHYAHELADYDGKPLQIIHRDISPHNLFVTYEGQVKVVDFGIAKAVSSSAQTEVGVLKGKVAYMSPEQAMGEVIDRRTDLYAMGIVLWESLTLEYLVRGESASARLKRLLTSGGVPRVSSLVPDIDPKLDDLVAKALDRDPDQRFQTASEMRDALEAWIAGTGAAVRQEELGRQISAMFKSVREEVKKKVRAQMAAAETATSMEDLAPLSLGGGGGSGSASERLTIRGGSEGGGSSGGQGTGSGSNAGRTTGSGTIGNASALSVVAPISSSKRTVAVTAIAGVVLLGGFGIWQFNKGRDVAAPQPSALASAPAPSASVPLVSTEIDEGRIASFGALPTVVSSPTNPLSEDKIALGRMLYYEPRLSKGQDVSCNSCHLLDAYGVDGKKVSSGHQQQTGTRNSPTVYNSAGFFALMWDGKFASVEDQAKGPMLNAVEMAGAPKRIEEVLASIPEYVTAFGKAFPGEKNQVSFDNVAKAIAAFERKLFTPARWEKFLAGEKSALSDAEKRGFNTFVEVGCPTCHFGPYVGASMFQKLGLVKAWPYTRDRGRYELTQKNEDYMVFRVPSLRNVAMTGPYLHDGSLTSLDEVVKMMARHQIGKEITDDQAASIVDWLKSLTGDLPRDYIQKPELPPNGKRTPGPQL
jgi:cytochrome c peroxidase